MGRKMFKSLIKKLRKKNDIPLFMVEPVKKGLSFILREEARHSPDEYAFDNQLFALQLIKLRMLHEQGLAEKTSDGYFVPSEVVVSLDDNFNYLFRLPKYFDGSFRLDVRGLTTQANFDVDIKVFKEYELPGAHLEGPYLQVGAITSFSLTEPQWSVLKAIELFKDKSASDRNAFDNNYLIHELKAAIKRDEGTDKALPKLKINLEHFEKLQTHNPDSISVSAEKDDEGNLILGPVFAKCSPDAITRRLANIPKSDSPSVLHVGDEVILLTPKTMRAIHQILNNRVIPKNRVKDFLKSPTAFIKDASIDFDTGFSLRVKGAERFTHKYFGEVEVKSSNWFDGIEANVRPLKSIAEKISDEDDLNELETRIRDAQAVGAETIQFKEDCYLLEGSKSFDVVNGIRASLNNDSVSDDHDDVVTNVEERVVVKIEANDEVVDYSENSTTIKNVKCDTNFSTDNLLKTPYPHQNEGIRWILSRFELGQLGQIKAGGGLLADDMGLGKTFMTLVALEEIQKRYKKHGQDKKPVLIVAPLSLIENWENEVKTTFKNCPFEDIVVLQANRDLKHYQIDGSIRETRQSISDAESMFGIRYALKVGKRYVPEQLDRPGRLVLTTYDTLREYQFSLSRIDWSFVAFDEAQFLKNPNALVTRAAKGLKSDFKLLMTGTPVENSLKDIWCLMDTALPGLLGAWQSFRSKYIQPINKVAKLVKNGTHSADDLLATKIEIGKELRTLLGDNMIRRTKEDQLSGLPKKVIFSPRPSDDEHSEELALLGQMMSGSQLESYNNIVRSVNGASKSDRAKMALVSLMRMKIASIHHELNDDNCHFENVKPLDSCKIKVLDRVLEDIKARNEKVVIFAITKKVQEFLSAYLQTKYHVPVRVVNGETKAVVDTSRGNETREFVI